MLTKIYTAKDNQVTLVSHFWDKQTNEPKKKAKQNQTTKLIWAVKLLIIPMQVQWICNKSKYNRFSPIQKVFHLSEP